MGKNRKRDDLLMYQVVTMYSENEPWWFFDDWQQDVTETMSFEAFSDAEHYFLEKYRDYQEKHDELRCKDPYLVAFWNEGDTIYCEDCDDELQAFTGLMLLYNHKKLDDGDNNNHETTHYSGKAKCCQRLSKSARRDTNK